MSPRVRRPLLRYLSILAVVAMLTAGVVVTATASPGPSSDVKSAAYGGGTTPATKGPCKGIGGEAGATCQANAKAQYQKAVKACKKKKTASKRSKCKAAAKKKWGQ